jgi:hypothetical protein
MLRNHSRRGVLPVEIRSDVGLGARLEWCLEIMAYCSENGLVPQFKFSYPDSAEGEDYFAGLFSIRGSDERQAASFITISSIVELDLGKDYDAILNIEMAQDLISKYLVVNEDVIGEVDAFCRLHFSGRKVLGVHYRGTDKVLESPTVSPETVRKNIGRYLQLYPETERIFIATDDLSFLQGVRTSPLRRPIVFRDDAVRSRDGSPVHRFSHTDRYAMNRDAIVNCLLLARCDALMKTSSILSDWSKLFNTSLPVVVLNEPYAEYLWFPERDLIQQNLFQPIR